MGAFPICPEMSRFVPVCPLFPDMSPFWAPKRTNEDTRDKMGHFGTNWETPPFRMHPHLALLKSLSSGFSHYFQLFSHDFREASHYRWDGNNFPEILAIMATRALE